MHEWGASCLSNLVAHCLPQPYEGGAAGLRPGSGMGRHIARQARYAAANEEDRNANKKMHKQKNRQVGDGGGKPSALSLLALGATLLLFVQPAQPGGNALVGEGDTLAPSVYTPNIR